MAAHEQGKFWEMHDKLFANQQRAGPRILEKYAQELRPGHGQVQGRARLRQVHARRSRRTSAAGTAVGANGTPTFFINGRELVGAQPFESFKAVIDEEIAKADKLLAAGTKPEDLYAKLHRGRRRRGRRAGAAGAAAEPAGAEHRRRQRRR